MAYPDASVKRFGRTGFVVMGAARHGIGRSIAASIP
jgi:hypothetical protein